MVVLGRGALLSPMLRQSCYHAWCRHVAFSDADARLAVEALAGPLRLPPPSTEGVVVLGISGCSRSGKSVLSGGLAHALGESTSWVLNADTYFNLGWITSHRVPGSPEGRRSMPWDSPGAVDHAKLLGDFRAVLRSAEGVFRQTRVRQTIIVEGFLVFFDPVLASHFHRRIWLDLPYAVARARRMATARVPADYYDSFLWPSYLRYEQQTFSPGPGGVAGIVRLDATRSEADLLARARAAIQDPASSRL